MKSKFKIVFYNIFILIGLIMFLELASALYLDCAHFYRNSEEIKNLEEKIEIQSKDKDFDWPKKYIREFTKLRTEYRSYFGWRRMQYDGVTIHINSQGIRKTIQDSFETDSNSVAVFLGGSTMWGTGVSNEHTIPSLFAGKSNKEYKVLNFGEAGYTAYQSFQFFQLKIIEGLKPQLVISYDGVNNSPVRANFFSHAREKQIADNLKDPYFLKSTRILISKVKRRLYSPSKKSLKDIIYPSQERNRKAAIELLESWLLMRQACNLLGADFICVLQPNTFVGTPNIENIEKELKFHPYQNGYEYYDEVLELLESKRYNILKGHFLNFSSALDAVPNIYIDWCHVSPIGNEKIVDLLVNHLQNRN